MDTVRKGEIVGVSAQGRSDGSRRLDVVRFAPLAGQRADRYENEKK